MKTVLAPLKSPNAAPVLLIWMIRAYGSSHCHGIQIWPNSRFVRMTCFVYWSEPMRMAEIIAMMPYVLNIFFKASSDLQNSFYPKHSIADYRLLAEPDHLLIVFQARCTPFHHQTHLPPGSSRACLWFQSDRLQVSRFLCNL